MDDFNFGGGSSGGGLFDFNFGSGSDLNNFGNDLITDFGGGLNGGYTDFTGSGIQNFNPTNFGNSGSIDYDFGQADMPELPQWSQGQFTTGSPDLSTGLDSRGLMSLMGSTPTGGPLRGTQPVGEYIPTQKETGDDGWGLNGISDFLGKLFGNKTLMGGLGALFEGSQNRKQAKSMQKIAQQNQAQQQLERQAMMQRQDQQQQVVSPYDRVNAIAQAQGNPNVNSMRDAMQQKLLDAMQNPYQVPIVQQQVDALTQAQRRKDAAAGRRSNDATSNPQLLAEAAKIAQNYIQNLQGPAGANITPNYPGLNNNLNNSGVLQALLNASRYDTNGYVSPLMSAIGFGQSYNTPQTQPR